MPDLEERVRTTLRQVAEGVVPSEALDDAVSGHLKARPRRFGRRSRWLVAVAGAVAIGAIAVTVVGIRATRTTHEAITPGASTPSRSSTSELTTLRDVQNLAPSAARRRLESDGLTVAIEYRTDRVSPGRILEQRPPPGTHVARGDQVVLVVDAFLPCGGFFHPTDLPKDFHSQPRPGPAPEAAVAHVPNDGFALHYTDGRGRSIEIRRPATPRQENAGGTAQPADAYVLGQAVTMFRLASGRDEPLIARFFFPFDQSSDPCGSYSINGYGVTKREMRLFAEGLVPNP